MCGWSRFVPFPSTLRCRCTIFFAILPSTLFDVHLPSVCRVDSRGKGSQGGSTHPALAAVRALLHSSSCRSRHILRLLVRSCALLSLFCSPPLLEAKSSVVEQQELLCRVCTVQLCSSGRREKKVRLENMETEGEGKTHCCSSSSLSSLAPSHPRSLPPPVSTPSAR